MLSLRRELSHDEFLLAQLDQAGPLVLERLSRAYRGFLSGWFAETDLPLVLARQSFRSLKYSHRRQAGLYPPVTRAVPERIRLALQERFRWYYTIFYPGVIE